MIKIVNPERSLLVVYVCMCVSCTFMSDSLWLHGLGPARLLCTWNSPGKNTGVGSHSLLQGIFPTQRSNLDLLHCRWTLQSESPGKPWWIRWIRRNQMLDFLVLLIVVLYVVVSFWAPYKKKSQTPVLLSIHPNLITKGESY